MDGSHGPAGYRVRRLLVGRLLPRPLTHTSPAFAFVAGFCALLIVAVVVAVAAALVGGLW